MTRALAYQQRKLGETGTGPVEGRALEYLAIASSYGLCGQIDKARRTVIEAERLWPFATVRTWLNTLYARGLPDPAYVAQLQRIWQGLRIAGLRERAEEDGPFGVAPNGMLHRNWVGFTPEAVTGATTIRTSELAALLSRRPLMLIDVAMYGCGRLLPGTIGLEGSGFGAAFSDQVQACFTRKIHALTRGDRSAPIVAYCANSEHFTGYNLAARPGESGEIFMRQRGWPGSRHPTRPTCACCARNSSPVLS